MIKKDGTMELLSTHFNDKNAGKAESVRDELGLLRKFQVCEATQKRGSFIFPNRYEAQFSKATFNVVICEENTIKEIYQNAELYGKLGVEMCICIDMSLAKGGTEPIVESFYSSMKAQTMYGGQNNDILALRTKLEWLLPPVIQADKLVHGTAHVYLNGDKLKSYQGHKWPTIGDRRHKKPYATSKVVDRIANTPFQQNGACWVIRIDLLHELYCLYRVRLFSSPWKLFLERFLTILLNETRKKTSPIYFLQF